MPTDTQPVLRTARLTLRPFHADDSPRLAALAGDKRISDTMISFPRPYGIAEATADITRFAQDWQRRHGAHYALVAAGPDFDGYFALKSIDEEHRGAEISFWIGPQASGQGYVQEAGREVIRFAFEDLKLNRLCAHHMVRNPASAKVVARLGFRPEGVLRDRVRKCGVFEDVVVSALLAREWR